MSWKWLQEWVNQHQKKYEVSGRRRLPRLVSHHRLGMSFMSALVVNPEVDELSKKVLQSFSHWRKETLDLHELFEAGGNDPNARTEVFDIVERFVKEGVLSEEGNDFYSLTDKGKALAKSTGGSSQT